MARVNKQYREDAKERIIAAAIDVAVEKGWDALTLDAIAQSVGVTIPALYSYFRNRDELRNEVVVKVLRINQADLEATLTREGDIHRNLRDYADLIFIQQKQYANIFSNLSLKFLQDPEQREKILPFYRTGSILIRDCLARAQSRGEIPQQVNPDRAARQIYSITIGFQLSSMFIEQADDIADKALWTEAVERILLIDRHAGST
jgi:AcrR family transcriptional regulator